VVKAGVWLMPQPDAYDFLAFEYTADEALFPAFIDDFRRLIFQGAIRSRPHLANDFAMLCIVSQYPRELLAGRRSLDAAAMAVWRKRHGVTRWTFGCGLYGTRREIRLQKSMIRRVLSRYGTLRFLGACVRPGLTGRLALATARLVARASGKSPAFLDAMVPAIQLFQGVPTDYFVRQVYFKSHATKPNDDIDPARDGCGFMWIGPVVPFTSRHVDEALSVARPIYQTYEFDFFVELIVESGRSMIVLFGIFYDKADAGDSARATAWYDAMKETFVACGYPPYRASVHATAHALESNPVLESVVRDIKAALDPANILAPGRYGTPTKNVDTVSLL
jgi:4-cresol dehydrogenase (hydroxylating)